MHFSSKIFQLMLLVLAYAGLTKGVNFKYSKVETFVITEDGEDSLKKTEIDESKNINKVSTKELDNSLFSVLTRQFTKHRVGDSKNTPKVFGNGFKWKSCGSPDQLVDIHNLTILPSPLSFPGQLTFGFDVIFHDTIEEEASVQASLKLEYSRTGESWLTIPCVDGIGSCTYNDFCEKTKIIQCPDDLKKEGIPCTCPFNKGEYKVKSYNVEVDAAVFFAGYYQGDVTITDSSKGEIACYEVDFVVA